MSVCVCVLHEWKWNGINCEKKMWGRERGNKE